MKTLKILLLSFLAITLMSASCSADEETTANNNSFTVPEQFRDTFVVYSHSTRNNQIVEISTNSIDINNGEIVINESATNITNNGKYFNVLGGYFSNGSINPEGQHTVGLVLDDGSYPLKRVNLSYLNEITGESLILYLRN